MNKMDSNPPSSGTQHPTTRQVSGHKRATPVLCDKSLQNLFGPRGVVYCPSDTHAAKQVNSCGLEPVNEENCHIRRGKKNKKRKFSSPTVWTAPSKTVKTKRRFQKQKQGLCGVIAINNAVGKNILHRDEVDIMVKKLQRGGDETGNYSAEPLHLALQQKGRGLARIKGKTHMWLATQKTGLYLVLGWHLSYNKPMHYIAVDAAAGLVIDGAKKNMKTLDAGGILACLSYGVHRIWKIN